MSVVAWDGKTLAADCQATCADLKTKTKKIFQVGKYILGFSGDEDKVQQLLAWYKDGCKYEDWPKFQEDKERWTRMIIASTEGVFMYEQTPYPMPILADFTAWGSGRDFAIGAMEMGADARRAVEVANIHSTGCGFGVESYSLENLK